MWRETAERAAQALEKVPGVQAVALGGSHCTGTATDHSDIDIGVYYRGSLDTKRMDDVLAALDDGGRQGLLNKPGEWGKWINGGAWMTLDGWKTDILLRDLDRVREVIGDCQMGKVTVDFQAGHPFGFVNAIYLGEVKYCLPLRDPKNALQELKRLADPVSGGCRRAASAKFLWEADFSNSTGRSAAAKRDIVYAAGSMFRTALCLAQALFFANGEVLLNEKGAMRRLAQAPFCPPGFAEGLESALQGLDKENLTLGFDRLSDLHAQAARLVSKLLEA